MKVFKNKESRACLISVFFLILTKAHYTCGLISGLVVTGKWLVDQ